jgi:hypothetical protein
MWTRTKLWRESLCWNNKAKWYEITYLKTATVSVATNINRKVNINARKTEIVKLVVENLI